MMNISDNPFFVLEVSTRDNRQQITAAADDKAFLNDSNAFSEARTALVIPDKRLWAEIRWFPGMEDERVREIVGFFRRLKDGQPPGPLNTSGFRSITLLNFAVYMFSFRRFRDIPDMTKSILAMCRCFDTLNAGELCAVINNDRGFAGFPVVGKSELERELNSYRNDILRVIDGRLSVLPQKKYTGLAGELAVNYADEGGKYYASFLLNDLLAAYELNILPSLEEHKQKILGIVWGIESEVPENVFEELSRWLKQWRSMAAPLIQAAKVIGMDNVNLSNHGIDLFNAVRERALNLNNAYHNASDALKLLLLMKETLDGIQADLTNTIHYDIKAVLPIALQQRQAEKDQEAWAKSLYYEVKIGQDRLRISADGILWNGVLTPLEAVSGISWGAIATYNGDIHTGTEYRIAVMMPHSTLRLEPDGTTYNELTKAIWRAVSGSLFRKMLTTLENGKMLSVGGISLNDDGVYLRSRIVVSHGHCSPVFTYFFTWAEPLEFRSKNGSFIISSESYSASASYIDDMNTHVLESIVRQFYSIPAHSTMKLSDML